MSIFGRNIKTTVFGESHGRGVGVTVTGLAPGIKVDDDNIAFVLRRRLSYAHSTPRHETAFEILSGVYNGFTTGAPLTVFLPNKDSRSSDYETSVARPGHADYTEYVRSNGFCDLRGGGYHSGRLTAPIAAVGAVVIPELARHGICVASHVYEIGGIKDTAFTDLKSAELISDSDFPMIDTAAKQAALQYLSEIKDKGDSCGGIAETVIFGLPAGLGGGFGDAVDSQFSAEIFAIPSVKGVIIGDGEAAARGMGSEMNDQIRASNGAVYCTSNHSGGIVGGITNGMPVVIRTYFKPVPSIALMQKTVSLADMQNTDIEIVGRHDVCTVCRAMPAIDALCALKICDLLTQRYGTQYFASDKRMSL